MRSRRAKGWVKVMNWTTRAKVLGLLIALAACDNLLSWSSAASSPRSRSSSND